jgi:hypothetical protein
LENAGFHAVIADAVPSAGGHGVIDDYNRERADRMAVIFEHVHLGDFFIERTTREFDAEDTRFVFAGFFFQASGATVFGLVVALDAVVGLVESAGEIGTGVGEFETFAVTPV